VDSGHSSIKVRVRGIKNFEYIIVYFYRSIRVSFTDDYCIFLSMKLIFFHDKNLNFVCSYFSFQITPSVLDFNMLSSVKLLFLFSLL
jgi:hypothetical protein